MHQTYSVYPMREEYPFQPPLSWQILTSQRQIWRTPEHIQQKMYHPVSEHAIILLLASSLTCIMHVFSSHITSSSSLDAMMTSLCLFWKVYKDDAINVLFASTLVRARISDVWQRRNRAVMVETVVQTFYGFRKSVYFIIF